MIDFEQLKISEKIKDILSEFKINFVFQPIFNRNNDIIGHEALMRPVGYDISEYIEIKRKENKLHSLELATFFGAAYEFFRRKLQGCLSINSFPSECLSLEEFSEYYMNFSELEKKLVIEILEYDETDFFSWEKKKEYSKIFNGITFALDDFGTGFNGINAVQYYDTSIIKIDRSLISNISYDPNKQEVFKSIIRLFHELDKKVLAEGVETESEYNWLLAEKTDFFQGYYLGRPN